MKQKIAACLAVITSDVDGSAPALGAASDSIVIQVPAGEPRSLTLRLEQPGAEPLVVPDAIVRRDLEPPVAIAWAPAGARIPVGSSLQVTFDEPIDPASKGAVVLFVKVGGVWSEERIVTAAVRGNSRLRLDANGVPAVSFGEGTGADMKFTERSSAP